LFDFRYSFDDGETVTPEGDASPLGADCESALPIAMLAPDEYLLTIVATPPKGCAVRRDVRLSVR